MIFSRKLINCSLFQHHDFYNFHEVITDAETLKNPRNSKTRWLFIEPAVGRLLAQWNELKLHF